MGGIRWPTKSATHNSRRYDKTTTIFIASINTFSICRSGKAIATSIPAELVARVIRAEAKVSRRYWLQITDRQQSTMKEETDSEILRRVTRRPARKNTTQHATKTKTVMMPNPSQPNVLRTPWPAKAKKKIATPAMGSSDSARELTVVFTHVLKTEINSSRENSGKKPCPLATG